MVPNEAVLVGLGVAAVVPSVLNVVSGGSPSVVLLPLIDSANHLETAGSSIDFNPLTGAFELSVQPDCIVAESDGKQQLFISYGPKKDTELLLNYGFIPGVRGSDSDAVGDNDSEAQRQALAEAFSSRNG